MLTKALGHGRHKARVSDSIVCTLTVPTLPTSYSLSKISAIDCTADCCLVHDEVTTASTNLS